MAESRRGDFYILFLGLLLGFATSSFLSPKLILWYSDPPYNMGVNCSPAIDWGLTQIIRWQVAGMFIFAIGLWSIALLIKRRRVKDE